MFASKRQRAGSYGQEDMQVVPYQNLPIRNYPRGNGGRASSSYKSNGSSRRNRRNNSSPYSQLSQNVSHVNPRFPPPEIKTLDSGVTGAAPVTPPISISMPSAGATIALNDIPTGAGSSQRIGISVVVKSCGFRFEVDLSPTNPVPTSGRVMLVWDRQPNGLEAAFTDIFTTATYLSFAAVTTMQRFVILRNQQFSLSPNGNQTLFFDGFCKINMKSTFGTLAVPESGALLLAYISDQTVANQQPILQGTWRVRYVDV